MEKFEAGNGDIELVSKDDEEKDKIQEAVDSYQEFFSLTEKDFDKAILDVGAGEAEFVKYLRGRGNGRSFAVDLFNRGNIKDQPWFLVADVQRLPFKDSIFELVLARAVMPLFVQPEYPAINYGREMDYKSLIRELLRVTKSKGKIMFDCVAKEEYLEREKEDAFKNDEQMQQYWEARAKTAGEFREFINSLPGVHVSVSVHDDYYHKIICLTKF